MRGRFDHMITLGVCAALCACSTDAIEPREYDPVSASVIGTSATRTRGNVHLRDSTLSVGDTTSLSVVVRDRFGREVTRFVSVRFRSRDTTVATVTGRGFVKVVGHGSTWILVRSVNETIDSVAVRIAQPVQGNGSGTTQDLLPPAGYSPNAEIFTDTVSVMPTQATLPRRFVTHSFPVSTRTIRLGQGANLQAAIDSARRGDEIVLASGAVFNGGFKLRKKSGSGWVTIRSEDAPSTPGVRPAPRQFASAAKLITIQNGVPALDAEAGASGYWISGIEVAASSKVTTMGALVFVSPARGVAADVPSRIVLERSYVHGHDQLNMQRCVHFDATDAAIADSWISDCHFRGLDSQALLVITSPGQLLFRNNFLSGAGENLMIGGGGPGVSGMIPEDIEIVGNHFYKPLSWQAAGWTVKNLLEIKIGRRIDIRDNYLENNWVMGQIGFAVVIKAADQDAAPWVRTSDIVFRRNIVTGSAAGVNVFEDGPVGTNRVSILANQFSNIGLRSLGGVGRMIQLIGKLTDIEVRHNTMVFGQSGSAAASAMMMDGRGSERLTIVNNVFQGGEYGFILSGGGTGVTGVQQYAATSTVVGNAISLSFGAAAYGTQNLVVPSVEGFGFVSVGSGDLRLVSGSRVRQSGARGATPGVPAGALTVAAAARSAPQ